MKIKKKPISIFFVFIFIIIAYSNCSKNKDNNKPIFSYTSTINASSYKKDVPINESGSVMIAFQEGSIEHDNQTYSAGCHILEVKQGDTIKMDVKNLIMRQPGTECADF